MRKIRGLFICLFLFAFMLVGCEKEEISEKIGEVKESVDSKKDGVADKLSGLSKVFEKEGVPTFDEKEEFYAFLEEKIKAGEEKATAYIAKDIWNNGFDDMYDYIDLFYGGVKEANGTRLLKKGYYEVTMDLVISDDCYAEKILFGEMNRKDATKRAQKVADKATEVLGQIIKEDMTNYEKELAIHDYIALNATYDYETYEKIMKGKDVKTQDAYAILVEGTGVCEAYANTTKFLLDLCGVECQIISGDATNADGTQSHAWNLVKLGEDWYQVDTTWDDPTRDSEREVSHTYFNITDEQMARDHEWKRDRYPKAKGEKYNYYKKEGKYFETQEQAREYIEYCIAYEQATEVEFIVEDYSKEKYNGFGSFIWNLGDIKNCSYTIKELGEETMICYYIEYND